MASNGSDSFLSRQWRRLGQLGRWAREGRLREELAARRGFVATRVHWVADRLFPLPPPPAPPPAPCVIETPPPPPPSVVEAPPAPPPLPPRHVAAQLVLPTSDAPDISVVIPAYGQVGHTLACLASLAAHPPRRPFEVLVAEDASGDPRAPELRAVRGLRYLEWEENQGFLRSANRAAGHARGRFLFLLNNDTEVMPGCLDRLAALLEDGHPAFPGPVGLAGARLLYPDGWLQESGGILWNDGSAWNWGNRQDPRRAEFRYVREADYVSGAAIMVTRAAWDATGGFDEHFLPAYCEDADLAFRLRAKGFRTLVAPDATVIHHEGVSHGTDTTQGVKAHQVTNLVKLAERHAAALSRHERPGTHLLRARDRAPSGGARRVVLVADNNILTPDQDAGSRSVLSVIEAQLAAGHAVKFWPLNGLAMPGYLERMERMGVECPVDPHRLPFDAWIAQNGEQIDRVFISRPHVATALLRGLRLHAPQAPVVFYGQDLHHARIERQAAVTADPAERERLLHAAAEARAEEERLWRDCDLSLFLAKEEEDAVRAWVPEAALVTLMAFSLPPLPETPPGFDGRAGGIFVAGFAHPPNRDAALFLVREVLPLIRARMPGFRLALVGSHPTEEIRALASDAVEVTGFVSDEELRRRYETAAIALCPLRFGAGVKGKVVEALHAGLPLVTTSIGLQGLADAPCPALDDAPAMAAEAARLATDRAAWEAQAARQMAYARDRLSFAAYRDALDAAFLDAEARRMAQFRRAMPG